ncbi:inner membrane protein [Escherichia coli]|nr:inner membrane protein [Escherichia coli]
MEKYLHLLSRGDKIGLTLIRLSIAIVFMWIGLLKFVPYEADSITPFVANSPLMSFFYEHPEDGSDSNLLIVFYVQIMPDDLVMQLHRF